MRAGDQQRLLVTVLAAAGLAVLLTAAAGEYAPVAAQVVGLVLSVVGLVVLGRVSGWLSIPVMTVCVVIVGYVGGALFYDDQAGVPPDRRVSYMDDIGNDPAAVIYVLPAVWIVLVLAVVSRRWGGRDLRARAPD